MAKKIVVERCKDCPHIARKGITWKLICSKLFWFRKEITDINIIPDWCPLEDETEE